jgi:hypothetical protein
MNDVHDSHAPLSVFMGEKGKGKERFHRVSATAMFAHLDQEYA